MLKDVERYQERTKMFMIASGAFIVAAVLMLIGYNLMREPSVYGDPLIDEDMPGMALQRLQFETLESAVALYWLWAAGIATMVGFYLLIVSDLERRKASRLLKKLSTEPQTDSLNLARIEELLEVAKLEAAFRNQELESLHAKIAAAERMEGHTDEQLRQIGEALGINRFISQSHKWGWIQVALAVGSLAVGAILTFMAQ